MNALVGIIMGSDSDLKIMEAAAEILQKFEIEFELTIVSAHRTPMRMVKYATSAHDKGLKVITYNFACDRSSYKIVQFY